MDDRTTARLIGAGRAVFGLLCIVFPKLILGPGGREASGGALGMVRLFGVRDLVLGAGALKSVNEQHVDTSWVKMGALADTGDIAVVLATRKQLGRPFTFATLSLAIPAALLGWKSSLGLGRR